MILYGEQALAVLQHSAQATQTFSSATIFPFIVTTELSLIADHTMIWPIGKPSTQTGYSTSAIESLLLITSPTQICRSILPILLGYHARSRPTPGQPAQARTEVTPQTPR